MIRVSHRRPRSTVSAGAVDCRVFKYLNYGVISVAVQAWSTLDTAAIALFYRAFALSTCCGDVMTLTVWNLPTSDAGVVLCYHINTPKAAYTVLARASLVRNEFVLIIVCVISLCSFFCFSLAAGFYCGVVARQSAQLLWVLSLLSFSLRCRCCFSLSLVHATWQYSV